MTFEVDQHKMNVIGLLWIILGVTLGDFLLGLEAPMHDVGEVTIVLMMVGLGHIVFGLLVNVSGIVYSRYKGDSA